MTTKTNGIQLNLRICARVCIGARAQGCVRPYRLRACVLVRACMCGGCAWGPILSARADACAYVYSVRACASHGGPARGTPHPTLRRYQAGASASSFHILPGNLSRSLDGTSVSVQNTRATPFPCHSNLQHGESLGQRHI